MKEIQKDASAAPAASVVSDDPAVLAQQARDAIEKSATELRKQRIPIATEPPTVYRP
jgi:hypothetical protein